MQQADESVSVNFNLYQAIVEQAADAIIFADREGAVGRDCTARHLAEDALRTRTVGSQE